MKHKSCWYRHHVILFRKAHQPLQKQTIASTSAEPEAEVEFSDSKADSEESDEEFAHQDYFTFTNPITKHHK